MSVPWARGRRALVLDVCHTRQWVECIGVDTDDGEPAWEASGLDECGDVIPDRWLGTLCPTELLPDQCPKCYATGNGEHAPGCMVAANLARGVPAFFAPWVMETAPEGRWFERDGQYHDIILHVAGADGALSPIGWDGHHGVWFLGQHAPRPGSGPLPYSWGFVALGPLGPTLSPWEHP